MTVVDVGAVRLDVDDLGLRGGLLQQPRRC